MISCILHFFSYIAVSLNKLLLSLPPHIDCSPGEMEEGAEELVVGSVGRVKPNFKPRCPWTGTSGGSPGSAGRAGSCRRDALWSTILLEESAGLCGPRRGATTTWTTAVLPLAKQGRPHLEAGATLLLRWVEAGAWEGRLGTACGPDRGRWVGSEGHANTTSLSSPCPPSSESPSAKGPWGDGQNVRNPTACCATIRLAPTNRNPCARRPRGPTNQSEGWEPGVRGRPASAVRRRRAGPRPSTAAVRTPRSRVSAREVRDEKQTAFNSHQGGC